MIARACVLAAIVAAAAGGCTAVPGQPRPAAPAASPIADIHQAQAANLAQIERLERQHLTGVIDRSMFGAAARDAWAFADSHYQPASGLTIAVGSYPYATIWDIGSGVAALFCARGLALIDQATYETRMTTLLDTLGRMPLYDGAVFNKMYDARSGAMVGRDERPTARGFGWSATDLGRLLIWLKIVSVWDERFAPQAAAIVARNDLGRVVQAGYLRGEDLRGGTPHAYQEARIGYEQYAAQGFAVWGQRAERALDAATNALPVWVYGEPLVADLRGDDRLTSEPYFLMGLETGWDPWTAALTRRLLRVQQIRYEKTGVVTLVSEDAIAQPPAYFYYYSVYTNGRQFGVDVQDARLVVDGPRWVSAKAAFALHALMPGWYTQLAVDSVRGARGAGGWASGVYEGSGRSTGTANINTAAVIMTAALYARLGHPLIRRSPDAE
jgi:hypothetical protein